MSLKKQDQMTPYQRWYCKHKAEFNASRRQRYREDVAYREKQKEHFHRYRKTNPPRRTLVIPPEYAYSLGDTAQLVGVDVSTLRDWLNKEYFPRPVQFGNAFRLTEDQVNGVARIKEFFDDYGSRQGAKLDEFEDLKVLIRANW